MKKFNLLITKSPNRSIAQLFFCILILTFTLLPFYPSTFLPSSCLYADWQTQTIDLQDFVGSYTSIALDLSGYPHISYYDEANGHLKYANWNGVVWGIQTVDTNPKTGKYTSIKIDTLGNPHISYYDEKNSDIKYARWDVSEWKIETVDSAGEVGMYSSLALDSKKQPHISYYDSKNGLLRYAKFSKDNGWVIQNVDIKKNTGEFCSLALDLNDYPHISYYDAASYDLKYARWNGSKWEIHLVDYPGDVGWFTSIALDLRGQKPLPHISYFDNTNKDLKYAKLNGSGKWKIQEVDSTNDVGMYNSIAIDTAESGLNIHISYFDGTNGCLKYAKLSTSGEWATKVIDSHGFVGTYTFIVLDKNSPRCPHISYFDNTNLTLKYANKVLPVTNISFIAPKNEDLINLAVAELDSKNVTREDASIVSDFIRTEFVNLKAYNVVERTNMNKILAEASFQQAGCTTSDCAIKMGKILNVKRIVVGSLSKLGETYYITVYLVDVETGKILSSFNQPSLSTSALKHASKVIAFNLANQPAK